MMRALVVCLVLAIAPGAAAAQEEEVDAAPAVDGAIAAATLAAAAALSLWPVDTDDRWDLELFGAIDRSVRGRHSSTAAAFSDALLVTALATPLVLELGRGIDEYSDERILVYGETIAATALVTNLAKYTVQRPRPYVYRDDPRIEKGEDAFLSFFSGHSALSFAAATAGGYLYATGESERRARVGVWFAGMTVASATAMLRVRAGKHFYSDIIVGALVGVGVGWTVPRLHHDGGISLRRSEWLAIGAGVTVGTLVAALAPIPSDAKVRLEPLVLADGGGLALSGWIQ
jgi:hypothetical protein